MNIKMNKRVVILIATMLVLSSSLLSTGFAEDDFVNVKGFFSSKIKIFNANQQISLGKDSTGKEIKPFMMNSTTYVPIRALSEALGMTVDWDGPNSRIDITSKAEQDINHILQQVVQKQGRIEELEAKVNELESKLKIQNEATKANVLELERYLNKRHNEYRDVKFDILLSGNEKNITVKIYESKDGYYKLNSLTSSEIKSHIQNIVDDIRYDFRSAEVTGYVESYSGKEVVSFYLNSTGNVVIDTENTNGDRYDFYDIEDYLNRYHDSYLGIKFYINLVQEGKDIRVDIQVDKDKWSRMALEDKVYYIQGVYDDIKAEFPSTTIYGYVEDYYSGEELSEF